MLVVPNLLIQLSLFVVLLVLSKLEASTFAYSVSRFVVPDNSFILSWFNVNLYSTLFAVAVSLATVIPSSVELTVTESLTNFLASACAIPSIVDFFTDIL